MGIGHWALGLGTSHLYST